MRDAINTGLNTIERIHPSLTENAKKKIGKATEKRTAQIIGQSEKELERVTPVILKKLLNESYCKKYIFTYLVNFHVKKICVYSKN